MTSLASAPDLAEFGAPSAPGAAVSLRALSKAYGEKSVLRGLDLFVPAGQFVAIVGRSGCGKSTLLRLIAGLEPPSSGEIALGANEERPNRVARVMFQEPRLLPWVSVLGNVTIGLGADGERPEARGRATEALDLVGLADRAVEWPSVLSGALISRPRLLALDEPLGALDALTRIEMQQLLASVWLRERFTAILVTHDVAEAIALADRIVLIEQGALALDVNVDLPRPRPRGSAQAAALEATILRRLLGERRPVA